jgi:folate-dependent phosphoribosylglycinamide formyltransferase PurN
MTAIFLCTSTAPRHAWLARHVAAHHALLGVVCESKGDDRDVDGATMSSAQRNHHRAFAATELDLCGAATWPRVPMFSVPRGGMGVWDEAMTMAIDAADVVVLFGCSIVAPEMLVGRRVINLHMGLSPYYRGAATNLWPLVEGRPECIGATVHHATARVDDGGILGQVRPNLHGVTHVHEVGLRAMMTGAKLLTDVLWAPAPAGTAPSTLAPSSIAKKRRDFTDDTVASLGLWRDHLDRYHADQQRRDTATPIVTWSPTTAPLYASN